MNNLLIFGSYTLDNSGFLNYDVILYGQTITSPQMTFLYDAKIKALNYSDLVKQAKKRYCEYYGLFEDQEDIITVSHINTQTK
jgi:hypothetical protein